MSAAGLADDMLDWWAWVRRMSPAHAQSLRYPRVQDQAHVLLSVMKAKCGQIKCRLAARGTETHRMEAVAAAELYNAAYVV